MCNEIERPMCLHVLGEAIAVKHTTQFGIDPNLLLHGAAGRVWMDAFVPEQTHD